MDIVLKLAALVIDLVILAGILLALREFARLLRSCRSVLIDIASFTRASVLVNGRILEELKKLTSDQSPVGSVVEFYIITDGVRKKVEGTMDLSVVQNHELEFSITDKKGNPAKVDGIPVIENGAADLCDIVPNADGRGASLKPKGPMGLVTGQVTADADLGDGVETIRGTFSFNLVAGKASNIGIQVKSSTDQVEEAPAPPEEAPATGEGEAKSLKR